MGVSLCTSDTTKFSSSGPQWTRSGEVRRLQEENLPNMDEQIYEQAVKAEAFDCANPEGLSELDATLMDGLDSNETFDGSKLIALCQK